MSPQDSNQSHQNTEGATCQIDGTMVTESEDSVDAAAVRLAGENTDTDSVEKTGQVDNTDSRVVQSQTVEDTNVIPVTSSEQVILTETCDSLADTPHTDVIHSEDVPVTSSSTHIDNAELNCTNTNTSIDSNNEQIPCTEIVDEGDENNVVTSSPTQQEHSASSAQTLSNPTICVVECEDDDDNDEDESFVDAPSDQEEQSQIVTIVTESSDANTANQKCDSVEEKSSEI